MSGGKLRAMCWRLFQTQIISGSTIYGVFVQSGVRFVEHHDATPYNYPNYFSQISDGFQTERTEGKWEIKGGLVCYDYSDVLLDDGCTEVYRRGDEIQFANPATGVIHSISTRIEYEHGRASIKKVKKATPPAAPKAAPKKGDGFGSGFFVNSAGFIVSNSHVVEGCSGVEIRHGALNSTAVVIARDEGSDLAVLKVPSKVAQSWARDYAKPVGVRVSAKRKQHKGAIFRKLSGVRSGDEVVAVGHPLPDLLSSEANVTVGTVSALAGLGNDRRMLQMTAPIQAGNSGGPLLDGSGYVVGVVVAKLDALAVAAKTGNIPQNVNFAIKASTVVSFLEENGVTYAAGTSGRMTPAADIGEMAKSYTVLIRCRNSGS